MLISESFAKNLGAGLLVIVSILGPGSAWSQAPAETPPVNEAVCDSLIGGTPSLYGLCLAFWAQHCEPNWTQDNPFEDCSSGSQQILDLYAKRALPGDPPMPGIQEPCPCWSSEELAGLRNLSNEPYEFSVCQKDGSTAQLSNRDLWRISRPKEGGGHYYNTYVTTWVSTDATGPVRFCALLDQCDVDPGSCLNRIAQFQTTEEQFLACESQVASSALDRGLILDQSDCGRPQN